MEQIDIYTSTGVKFWRHPDQMISFIRGTGRTVVSTHISPTSKCQLNCDYCSVANRKQHESIEMDVIIKYIQDLIGRGLKAIIFTGGGEPTLYPEWNELIDKLRHYNLKFGLITNGVGLKNKRLEIFDWIRISLNYQAVRKIDLDPRRLKDNCVIGFSLVYSGVNKAFSLDHVNSIANRFNAEYVRVLPNCLPEELQEAHLEIDKWLQSNPSIVTHKIFHQQKYHNTPYTDYCPQAYFRPYLSEIGGGTVMPCDSVVLNDGHQKFDDKYAICKASDILDFLDGKIKQKFNPTKDCEGCVFADNIRMLDAWTRGSHQFNQYKNPIKHEEFV